MESTDPEEVMDGVVLAVPLQLHWPIDAHGDRCRLGHGVIGQASAEAASGTGLMQQDIAFLDSECRHDTINAAHWRLGGRPQLQYPVGAHPGCRVLWLEGRMTHEVVGVHCR